MLLRCENYEAEVSEETGRLNKLTFKGRKLVEEFEPTNPSETYTGVILAPWPNRIADGKYSWNGRSYQVEVNEVARNNALHGLLLHQQWRLEASTPDSLSLSSVLHPSESYPFEIAFQSNYVVNETGLHWTLTARNVGNGAAPYGVSIHPYLIANPDSTVNDWTLELDSREYIKVTPDRLLPIGVFPVDEADFQFQSGRLIGDQFIDHAFLVNSKNPVIKLTDSYGSGVKMTYDPSMKWVQIHTADRDGGLGSRTALAVEPMSCPPDAFNSGIDLITLNPGDDVSHSWSIAAIEK